MEPAYLLWPKALVGLEIQFFLTVYTASLDLTVCAIPLP
jgi:hypothetical protein